MIQTTSRDTALMNEFIIKELKKIDDVTWDLNDGNIYATRGGAETYPCIVAHTDTVHDIVDNFQIFELNDRLFSIDGDNMERCGIGGDDKVGVFVALEVIKKLKVCKVAFFRDEEIGCVGSKVADMTFFTDVEFVLQCDRQGYEDFVNEIYMNRLFDDKFSLLISDTLKKYGRKESTGGMTDVQQLVKNGIGVSVANMSCGYYEPHDELEYIVISEVDKTLDMVLEICALAKGSIWDVADSERNTYDYGNYNAYSTNHRNYNDNYGDWRDVWDCRGGDNGMTDADLEDLLGSEYPICPDCQESTFFDEHAGCSFCMGCESYIYPIKENGELDYEMVHFDEHHDELDS